MLNRGPDSELPELTFGSYTEDVRIRWTPRYAGYEYNWARTGATTHTLLTEGQHTGLAEQVASGTVDFAFMGLPLNDFTTLSLSNIGDVPMGMINVYGPIYSGLPTFRGSDGLIYDSVDEYVEGIIDRYVLAVDTVAMAGGQMLLGTGGSYSNVAATLTTFPDAQPSAARYGCD